ncbi:zinc finger MYM-type protein 1-like [Olea europaea var. sylvestris]|uniref:zinc finger MYM-type protein 1-like n=1 Tax=Olea europaea var. sylvestris TaxID=158386 RepID=UPI000C1D7A6C|nr:zinc finger MYM-type protein 1-like [Olea europaea var. sylvestris]
MSHVTNTCAQSLKDAIDAMFSTHGLSISSLRGQSNDGASNMSDALQTSYQANILEKLNIGELTGGSDVLENILEDDVHSDKKSSIVRQMNAMQDFEFVFSLHFMFEILAITDDISQALQKKDQDIRNAMRLLNLCKCALQNLRENSWDTLLSRVIEFCVDRHILVPNMKDIVVAKGLSRRVAQQVTYLHRFYVDLYCHAIDSILQELNDRFLETTTELFTCISCLSPIDLFAAFDKNKLQRLAQFYHLDFNSEELLLLRPQLDKFLLLVRMDEAFFNLNSISCVAQNLVETGSSCYFLLVYRLLTLALILPATNASVERVFSAMNLINTQQNGR